MLSQTTTLFPSSEFLITTLFLIIVFFPISTPLEIIQFLPISADLLIFENFEI